MTIPLMQLGHDIALVSLLPIYGSPRADPAAPTQREYSVTGKPADSGFYTCFHWDFVDSETDYSTIITSFGFAVDPDINDVTVYVRNHRFEWIRFNGSAIYPQMGQDVKYENFFIRNLSLYVVNLVEAS